MVVSFAQGLIFYDNRIKNSVMLAVTMGLFQAGMPVIGYTGADYIYELAAPFSKWIVFSIFFVLGMKFILDSFQPKKQEICCIGFKCLISLGVATSIDALVSGASLNFSASPLTFACFVIGIVSFLMSMSGFWLGNFVRTVPSKFLEILGGLILIFLSIKSLM